MDQTSKHRPKWLIALGLLVVLYWLALLVATHVPLAKSQQPSRSFDKLGHLGAFAVLSVLLCSAAAALRRPTWRLYAGVFALVVAYGAVDELSQRFTATRSSDFRDWLADTLGAAIGILCFAVFHRLVVRHLPAQLNDNAAG